MIKIQERNSVQQGLFEVYVNTESPRETFKQSSQIARILKRVGEVDVIGTSVFINGYNAELTADEIMWKLVDTLNDFSVDYFQIRVVSAISSGVEVWTDTQGSSIVFKYNDRAHLLEQYDFGGCIYYTHRRNYTRYDFPISHTQALELAKEMLDLIQ